MTVWLLAAGVWFVPPAVVAPQLDFASIPDPKLRPKFYEVEIEVLLASGRLEETRFDASDHPSTTERRLCDGMVWWLGSQRWTYRLDGLKITLLDVGGDPVVGITVRTRGWNKLADGTFDPVPVLGLAYQWAPRVPSKITRTYLSPYRRGGTPLARLASGAFGAVVTSIAAPELDFATLPDGKDRPRAYNIWVYPEVARVPGGSGVQPSSFHLHAHDKSREHIRAQCAREAESCKYGYRADALDLRLALLDAYSFPAGEREDVRKYPVVGLVIESDGPQPSVRWALRPEFRTLLSGN